MKLASLKQGGRDGLLAFADPHGTRAQAVDGYATLQSALDDWDNAQPALKDAQAHIVAGGGVAIAPGALAAPLPRAWQWLDGSAFPTHGELMQKAFNLPPIETDKPLMYQGLSHCFLGGGDDVPLPSQADGIDFEGEYGVITGDVPMGCSAQDALARIRLVILINDWSLRAIAPLEMKTGFGWIQAKPACSMAPLAVTPDELGEFWRDGRVHLPLRVSVNGTRVGEPHGGEMQFGFHDLIAHAARTRDLPAGTIIGSGTVSNRDYASVGSCCMSEVRAIETIKAGSPQTPFLSFGDRVAMTVSKPEGELVFGAIDQRVIAAVRR